MCRTTPDIDIKISGVVVSQKIEITRVGNNAMNKFIAMV